MIAFCLLCCSVGQECALFSSSLERFVPHSWTSLLLICSAIQVDLQYLNEILRDGADPNSVDKYGQTALHEVSCSASACQTYRRYSRGIWGLLLTQAVLMMSSTGIHFPYRRITCISHVIMGIICDRMGKHLALNFNMLCPETAHMNWCKHASCTHYMWRGNFPREVLYMCFFWKEWNVMLCVHCGYVTTNVCSGRSLEPGM